MKELNNSDPDLKVIPTVIYKKVPKKGVNPKITIGICAVVILITLVDMGLRLGDLHMWGEDSRIMELVEVSLLGLFTGLHLLLQLVYGKSSNHNLTDSPTSDKQSVYSCSQVFSRKVNSPL